MAQPATVASEPAQGAAAPAVAPQPLQVDDSGAAPRDDAQAQDGGISDLSEAGEAQAAKKKKKNKGSKGKATAKRGPTALPKNRGTRVLCRSAHDARRGG